VNFVQAGQPALVRTYERGVEDETLACGTGVVAVALILHATQAAGSPVAIKVRGGDTLHVGFENRGGAYTSVSLTGPADFVFDGQIGI
jgi:diaminopimelate epimerase